jgi:hypothetical protein
MENYGLKTEVPHASKLGREKIIPTKAKKILGGPKWSVPWLYSRWQFSKGDGSYLEGAGLWASSFLVDQRSSPTLSFGKDLKNLSI